MMVQPIYWLGEQVPQVFKELAREVASDLASVGTTFPRLRGMALADRLLGEVHCELLVEIAAGVTLPIVCNVVEPTFERADVWDAATILLLFEKQRRALVQQMDSLSEQLHDLRTSVRRICARWRAGGLPCQLSDVRLAPVQLWAGPREPAFLVIIEDLDDALHTTFVQLRLDAGERPDASLDRHRLQLIEKVARRIALDRLGASGWISQLALNAIAQSGTDPTVLRHFEMDRSIRLPNSVALNFRRGEVDVDTLFDPGQPRWRVDGFHLDEHELPEATLAASIGSPVTEVIDHPFLSDQMIVTAAEAQDEGGLQTIRFRLSMPQWLFCSGSGRIWPVDAPVEAAWRADVEKMIVNLEAFTSLA